MAVDYQAPFYLNTSSPSLYLVAHLYLDNKAYAWTMLSLAQL